MIIVRPCWTAVTPVEGEGTRERLKSTKMAITIVLGSNTTNIEVHTHIAAVTI